MHEPWPVVWQRALYGPNGFYRRPDGPRAHFRTASHAAGDLLARALARLARDAGCSTVVDVGAGHGELLAALRRADPDLTLHAVEVAPRPAGLDRAVGWADRPPPTTGPVLLLGWELLDVVPCPVLQADRDGALRQVLVSPDGHEVLGEEPGSGDLAWADRWWPGPHEPGDRVEVGTSRDDAWQRLVDVVVGEHGLALAVDYDHALGARPSQGSLTGFRAGRATAAVPDGEHDVTAHVALDAVAAGLPGSLRLDQADALRRLGVGAARPDPALSRSDPTAFVVALAATSRAAELLDRGGLGGFGWLLTPRGSRAVAAVRELTPGGGAGA